MFLHKVRAGAADRSYGIQVAKLAGLPAPVIKRAGQVLKTLEAGDRKGKSGAALVEELPLFAAMRPQGFAPADAPDATATPPDRKPSACDGGAGSRSIPTTSLRVMRSTRFITSRNSVTKSHHNHVRFTVPDAATFAYACFDVAAIRSR